MTTAPLIRSLPLEFYVKKTRKGERVHVYGRLKGSAWQKIFTGTSVKKAHEFISKITHYQKPKNTRTNRGSD